MTTGTVQANGLEFSYVEAGPADGPLALLLHGFPDSPFTWRHLMPLLAEAGYHAVAPFMRGYAPSGVAPDGQYQVGALVADGNALHAALGGGPDAVIIGHDWGAMATYGICASEPDRWRRAVTASVPPTLAVMNSFFTFDQLQRSWYTFFFQTPFAEMAVPLDDYVFIDRLWADWSPGYDAREDLIHVKEAIGSPERIVAAIGYYRALYDGSGHDPALAAEQAASASPMPIPTLYLHGTRDGALGLETAGDVLSYLPESSEFAVFEETGHFLHLEKPDDVNARIMAFLAAGA